MNITIQSLVTSKLLNIDLDLYNHASEVEEHIYDEFSSDEWVCVEYDNALYFGEHPDLADLLTINDALNDCYDSDALIAYIMMNGTDYFQYSIDNFEDKYQGQHASLADFTEQLVTDCYDLKDVPSFVVIDWQATWDCNLKYDYQVSDDNHVFLNI